MYGEELPIVHRYYYSRPEFTKTDFMYFNEEGDAIFVWYSNGKENQEHLASFNYEGSDWYETNTLNPHYKCKIIDIERIYNEQV